MTGAIISARGNSRRLVHTALLKLWLKPMLVMLAVSWLGAGQVLAHAALDSSDPANFAIVTEPLANVELRFTEGIEVAFSTFKVYRLDAEVDPNADDASMRLNALAAIVVSDHNGQQADDDDRVDAEVSSAADDKAVVMVEFDEPLASGHYVVMWRVLSVDTHVIDGHVIFTVVDE